MVGIKDIKPSLMFDSSNHHLPSSQLTRINDHGITGQIVVNHGSITSGRKLTHRGSKSLLGASWSRSLCARRPGAEVAAHETRGRSWHQSCFSELPMEQWNIIEHQLRCNIFGIKLCFEDICCQWVVHVYGTYVVSHVGPS